MPHKECWIYECFVFMYIHLPVCSAVPPELELPFRFWAFFKSNKCSNVLSHSPPSPEQCSWWHSTDSMLCFFVAFLQRPHRLMLIFLVYIQSSEFYYLQYSSACSLSSRHGDLVISLLTCPAHAPVRHLPSSCPRVTAFLQCGPMGSHFQSLLT